MAPRFWFFGGDKKPARNGTVALLPAEDDEEDQFYWSLPYAQEFPNDLRMLKRIYALEQEPNPAFVLHKQGYPNRLAVFLHFPTFDDVFMTVDEEYGGGRYPVLSRTGHMLKLYEVPGEPKGFGPRGGGPSSSNGRRSLKRQVDDLMAEQFEERLQTDPELQNTMFSGMVYKLTGQKPPQRKEQDPFEERALALIDSNPEYAEQMLAKYLSKWGIKPQKDKSFMDELDDFMKRQERVKRVLGHGDDGSSVGRIIQEVVGGFMESVRTGEASELVRSLKLPTTAPQQQGADGVVPNALSSPHYQQAQAQRAQAEPGTVSSWQKPGTQQPSPQQPQPHAQPQAQQPQGEAPNASPPPAGLEDVNWLELLSNAEWADVYQQITTLTAPDFMRWVYQQMLDYDDAPMETLARFIRLNSVEAIQQHLGQAQQLLQGDFVKQLMISTRGTNAYQAANEVVALLLGQGSIEWLTQAKQAADELQQRLEEYWRGQQGQQQAAQQAEQAAPTEAQSTMDADPAAATLSQEAFAGEDDDADSPAQNTFG